MSRMKVVLDACVMLPQNLNNVLLRLAEYGMFASIRVDAAFVGVGSTGMAEPCDA